MTTEYETLPEYTPQTIESEGVAVDLSASREKLIETAKKLLDAMPWFQRNVHMAILGAVCMRLSPYSATRSQDIDALLGGHCKERYAWDRRTSSDAVVTPAQRAYLITKAIAFTRYVFARPPNEWPEINKIPNARLTKEVIRQHGAKTQKRDAEETSEHAEGLRLLRIRCAPLSTLTREEFIEREKAEAVHRKKWKVAAQDKSGKISWVTGQIPSSRIRE